MVLQVEAAGAGVLAIGLGAQREPGGTRGGTRVQ